MADTKLFFENQTNAALYLLLRAEAGELEIHVSDRDFHGARKMAPLAIIECDAADVADCVRNRQLACRLRIRTKDGTLPGIVLDAGSTRFAAGPIYRFMPDSPQGLN
jgi:hypothetical protein